MGNEDISDKINYVNEIVVPKILGVDDAFYLKLEVDSPRKLQCGGKEFLKNWYSEWNEVVNEISLTVPKDIFSPLTADDRAQTIVHIFNETSKLLNDQKRAGNSNDENNVIVLLEFFNLLHISRLSIREGFLDGLERFLGLRYENENKYKYLSWFNSLFGSHTLFGKRPCNKLRALRHAAAHGNWCIKHETGEIIFYAKKNQKEGGYDKHTLDINSLSPLLDVHIRCGIFIFMSLLPYCK
jgi:hypothetical protein